MFWVVRECTVSHLAMPAASLSLLAIVRNSPAARTSCKTWLRRTTIALTDMSAVFRMSSLSAAAPTSVSTARPRTARAFCSLPRSLRPHASYGNVGRTYDTVCLLWRLPTMRLVARSFVAAFEVELALSGPAQHSLEHMAAT